MDANLPEPSDESLGAAIIEIDRARLPWPARWLLRDGSRARSVLADEIARRVEARVVARVREQTTREINASWEQAIAEQAADLPDPEPLPAFNSVPVCPKCLDRLVDPAVRAARWSHLPESMKRTCGKCGYWWLEAPADAEALCATQSAESALGDREDVQAANGAHSTTEETGTGHSPAEPHGGPHGHAETRVAVAAAPESPSASRAATGPSAAREEAEASRTVARPMLAPRFPERRPIPAATVDPAMCPRCKGDNSDSFELCDGCKDEIDILQQEAHAGAGGDDA